MNGLGSSAIITLRLTYEADIRIAKQRILERRKNIWIVREYSKDGAFNHDRGYSMYAKEDFVFIKHLYNIYNIELYSSRF